jgi:putative SOS response-associated peptidase YedK
MCGRFVSSTPPDQLARYFGAEPPPAERLVEANHNVAPTQSVYVVFERGGVRRLDTFHWGLVPVWAKDPKVGNRMINARAETLADKNAYKRPFATRRCIVPADGFYEWKAVPGSKRKQPVFIHRVDGEPLAFAGLWDVWRDPDRVDADGQPLELHSCTIVTGEANEVVGEVHDRMPVMLPPDAWDRWLDRDERDVAALGRLLVPAPAHLLTLHPVSTEVNNPRNNGPHLVEEAPPVDPDDT